MLGIDLTRIGYQRRAIKVTRQPADSSCSSFPVDHALVILAIRATTRGNSAFIIPPGLTIPLMYSGGKSLQLLDPQAVIAAGFTDTVLINIDAWLGGDEHATVAITLLARDTETRNLGWVMGNLVDVGLPPPFDPVAELRKFLLAMTPSYDEYDPAGFVEPFLVVPGGINELATREIDVSAKELHASEYLDRLLLKPDARNQVHYIIADAGQGKTWLMHYFEHVLLNKPGAPVPLLVSCIDLLDIIKEPVKLDRAAIFVALFNKAHGVWNNITENMLAEMMNNGQIIAIFDGLDEHVSRSGGGNDSISAWENAFRGFVHDRHVPIVVSTRKSILASGAEIKRLSPVYEVLPWSEDLIQSWLELNARSFNPRITDSPGTMLYKIKNVTPLAELCKVPFLLRAITEIYDHIKISTEDILYAIKKNIKKHLIYKEIIDKRLSENLDRAPLGTTPLLLRHLLQSVAQIYMASGGGCADMIALEQNGFSILSRSDRAAGIKLAREALRKEAESLTDDDPLLLTKMNRIFFSLVRERTMLAPAGSSGCTFPHQSIAEYLVAEAAYDEIIAREGKTGDLCCFLPTIFTTPETMEFLLEMLDDGCTGATPCILRVSDAIGFLSAIDVASKVSHVLIRWMADNVKKSVYTKGDIGRVVTEGFAKQPDIDFSNIYILQEPFDLVSPDGVTHETTTLLDLIFRNKQFKTLNLGKCRLASLLDTIGDLVNLEELWLDDNNLYSLPDTIGQLTLLKKLSAAGNSLTSLPGTIGQLTSLQMLYLGAGSQTCIPPVLGNYLTFLPETIGSLVNLKELYLEHNQLSYLPSTMGQLKSLTLLVVYHNKLGFLPSSMGQLKSLTRLDLWENKLTSLPETLGELKSLQTLDLSFNQLSFLPKTIGALKSLTDLNLESNQLSSLPGTIGQLTSLKELHLKDNKLSFLPETIGQLKSLTDLDIESNQLSTLPITMGQLASLKTLWLNFNTLTSLPETIGNLVSLKEFHLVSNRLTSLPGTMRNLVNLEQLWLGDNQIPSLPESIRNLANLKQLMLPNGDYSRCAHSRE